MQDPFACLRPLFPDDDALHYSLPLFAKNIDVDLSKIPFSLRILLESLLRGYDGKRITQELILALVKKQSQKIEIPLLVSRILLQDFTGVPLLVDLAAMRDAAIQEGINPGLIEPIIPVDLVVDHSVQVDRSSKPDAFAFNLELEFQRNQERYAFLNWGQQAFKNFRVVPPGVGIVHQVNLEYLAHVVTKKNVQGHTLAFFDTLLGTDSHTTMIGGLGVLGWGVGGIEAEAAMLGQPYSFPLPDVIGVHLHHRLQEGVTATDLALSITELLRKEKVVGQFVEFFGEGASYLSVADRATISNMAPEYGATLALFPVDDKTLDYLRQTGRPHEHVEFVHSYLEAQGMFGMPQSGEILFSRTLDLDLSLISPSIAGPKRPQDRIPLSEARSVFRHHLASPLEEGGYGKTTPLRIVLPTHPQENTPHITGGKESLGLSAELPSFSESEMVTNRPFTEKLVDPGYAHLANHEMLEHGSLVIAAITSCTNTSNPSVMIAAGLLAKKAVEKGLTVPSTVKTSLAPGSRVVTDYLVKAGLQPYLDQLGFTTVAYGCTTCIGNSGPLDTRIEAAIQEHDLIVASALSGNRNFEARIHGAVKANFLMSPPLVIAFALAGTVAIDFTKEPLGHTNQGVPVFLRDLWPTQEEIEKLLHHALSPMMFQERYKEVFEGGALWEAMQSSEGTTYTWESASTYIQQPPFLSSFQRLPPPLPQLTNLRALALLGDSVTTDHISPAGAFSSSTPAGQYLISLGIPEEAFNSYGSRRGNHQIMMRGTFANRRLRNKMASREGGYTLLLPEEKETSIFEASQIYAQRKTSLILFAGKDYGMGSSRDWAAKGTSLLGVRVVVARSFERIHRSNLIGMGILPLEFPEGISHESLALTGKETFSILLEELRPRQEVILLISSKQNVPLLSRLDTETEVDYYLHGGILPYVLRQMLPA